MQNVEYARPSASLISRRVVDAPVRMFHLLFGLCFAGAWMTAEGEAWRSLHVMLGYSLAGLLAFRALYGVIGPPQARLQLLAGRIRAARHPLRDWRRLLDQPLDGLRPLQHATTAVLVAGLLLLAIPVSISGFLTLNDAPEWMAELHESSAGIMLALALAHAGLVLAVSVARRQNLARPMLTGRAPGRGPDLVRHNRAWLAWLLLLAVFGYGVLAWQQAPHGLMSAHAMNRIIHGEEHDED